MISWFVEQLIVPVPIETFALNHRICQIVRQVRFNRLLILASSPLKPFVSGLQFFIQIQVHMIVCGDIEWFNFEELTSWLLSTSF
jgi:hypothetical protein